MRDPSVPIFTIAISTVFDNSFNASVGSNPVIAFASSSLAKTILAYFSTISLIIFLFLSIIPESFKSIPILILVYFKSYNEIDIVTNL